MKAIDNYVCEGQMSIFDIYGQDIWYGKTCPEPLVATKARTSDVSLKKFAELKIKPPMYLCLKKENGVQADVSWETSGPLLGEYMMHSFGECPKEENVSRLSQILEESPHQKYSLSPKACQGILRRAEKRGKELPPILKEALIRQSVFKNEQENQGGGKGILIQNERTGALSTLNNQSVVYCLQGNGIDRADTAGCNGKGWRENQSYTLNTIDRPAVCFSRQRSDELVENEVSSTQSARQYKDATDLVVSSFYPQMKAESQCYRKDGISNTLINGTNPGYQNAVCYGLEYDFSVVRRLTPLECERLQGYPDGWTNIGEWTDSKGKKHKDADSPRYKALGNSIALPFWEWMANRMVKELNVEHPTMASLFDGLGGFPLVYSRCGCEPIWASEIEEFPIAVTKIRFGE